MLQLIVNLGQLAIISPLKMMVIQLLQYLLFLQAHQPGEHLDVGMVIPFVESRKVRLFHSLYLFISNIYNMRWVGDSNYEFTDTHGFYWLTIWISTSVAWSLVFDYNSVVMNHLGNRYEGRSIRPVANPRPW